MELVINFPWVIRIWI